MGGWPSQFLRHQSTTSPVSSETQAIETPSIVLREDMATRRPVSPKKTEEHNASLVTAENLSRITNSLQDAHDVISLVPSILEYQSELEATIANQQRSRHAVCEDRVHIGESDVENISSSNRPSTLEMKYQEFYDHDRMDAIDIIEKSRILADNQYNQLEDNQIACLIFEEAYKAALESRSNFVECMSSILMAAPSIGAEWLRKNKKEQEQERTRKSQDPKERDYFHIKIKTDGSKTSSLDHGVVSHLNAIVKETSDICDIGALVQRIEDNLHQDRQPIFKDYDYQLLSHHVIKKYMIECSKYAWKLVCQTPPYRLEMHDKESGSRVIYDSARHQISRDAVKHHDGNSSSSQVYVHRVIWPGLFVGSPPRFIRKTEVILKGYV